MPEIPRGRLPRAAAAARLAMQLGKAAAQRAVRKSENGDRALGDAMVAELDALKGLAMKVGQILSYMDVGLPDSTVAALARLQTGAQPMGKDEVGEIIAAELGLSITQAFEEFDEAPVAAASIGQVHRAKVGGKAVAVKVRYPHVRASLASDIGQLAPIASLASFATAVDGATLIGELRARLLEECDYRSEASWQGEAAVAFEGSAEIQIPPVVATHSSEAVLTTRWAEGSSFAALEASDASRRNRVGRVLARFPWVSLFQHGFLHADPHPGNFLFPVDGPVVVLDWGSTRRFSEAEVSAFREVLRPLARGDRAKFRSALISTGLAPHPDRFDFDASWEMHRWLYAPYLESNFTFRREWWQAGRRFTGPNAPNQRHHGLPPAWMWLLRVQWGLSAVLTRLEAEGDFRGAFAEGMQLRF